MTVMTVREFQMVVMLKIIVVLVTVMAIMTVYRIVLVFGAAQQKFQIFMWIVMVMVWVLAVPYLFVMLMCH